MKKLKLISTIRTGLSFHHPSPIPPLSDEEQDDFSSCSIESSMLDFEDARVSISDQSTAFPLSEEDSSTESETDMFTAEPTTEDVENRVVLYSTSLAGIRKTFNDCAVVRFILKSFKVRFEERDVSMHREYRDMLWDAMGGKEEKAALPLLPKLFIGGRCIGGSEEVVGLHDRGELRKLLEGLPIASSTSPCHGCGSLKFVICTSCSGSRRVILDDDPSSVSEKWNRCGQCNENGLVRCPICIF